MLTLLEIYTKDLNSLPLQMHFNASIAVDDTVQIRGIDGLGPVKADIASTQYGLIDGEFYTGGTVGKRNMVVTVGLNPDWEDQTISSLRQELYKYFMPKRHVTTRFYADHMETVEIEGYVESVEPNMFSNEPEMQISILCPYPHFKAIIPTVAVGRTQAPGAYAAFKALPLQDRNDTIDPHVAIDVLYRGTVSSGFEFNLKPSLTIPAYTGPVAVGNNALVYEELRLVDVTVDGVQHLELGTVVGSKYIVSVETATGVRTSIIGHKDSASDWLQLYPGENFIQCIVDAAFVGQDWELTYYNTYGGL